MPQLVAMLEHLSVSSSTKAHRTVGLVTVQDEPEHVITRCLSLQEDLGRSSASAGTTTIAVQDAATMLKKVSLVSVVPTSAPPSPAHSRLSRFSKKPSFKIQLPRWHFSGQPATSCPQARQQALLTPPEDAHTLAFVMDNRPPEKPADNGDEALAVPALPSLPTVAISAPEHVRTPSPRTRHPFLNPVASSGTDLLAEALDVALLNLQSMPTDIKIVNQSLPCPSEGGHSTSRLGPLIGAIQKFPGQDGARWLEVTQAYPQDFPASKIPTSPPMTPGGTHRHGTNQDYFNQSRVISTATIALDRYCPYGNAARQPMPSPAGMPPNPGYFVRPSSANFAIYERFVPPSTAQEYLDLFEPSKPSAIADRLRELLPGGSLTVVYPTRSGAETFLSTCLQPVLDPVLRRVVAAHGLSDSIAYDVRDMPAARHLLSYPDLCKRFEGLADRMSRPDPMTLRAGPTYSKLYQARVDVYLPRRVWETWWVQQETARVRHYVGNFFRDGDSPVPADLVESAAGIVREILDGVRAYGYAEGEAPDEGDAVEVGVFVFQRMR